ncbi:hypothetical protein SHI21_13490 [Bacteriovorax sp. PP10]|uniref:Uncharacterized protein n=1 Tax=Bacteriovorax antarcticus TaxID=3088717 RepID=A0ABU5VW11_9BACT|nr:hypothetical protein [Bacteriovorax sp. PP10]MEA9357232.1 hypothetical protein [Bacteriovorax sp. PP10]
MQCLATQELYTNFLPYFIRIFSLCTLLALVMLFIVRYRNNGREMQYLKKFFIVIDLLLILSVLANILMHTNQLNNSVTGMRISNSNDFINKAKEQAGESLNSIKKECPLNIAGCEILISTLQEKIDNDNVPKEITVWVDEKISSNKVIKNLLTDFSQEINNYRYNKIQLETNKKSIRMLPEKDESNIRLIFILLLAVLTPFKIAKHIDDYMSVNN